MAIEVLPVDDINLPRDTRLTLGGGLPDGVSSLVYRVPSEYRGAFVSGSVSRTTAVRQTPITRSSCPTLCGGACRTCTGVHAHHTERSRSHYFHFGFGLSKRFIDLLIQVTAFTVAHSVTLALGLYGVLRFPASVVEPLIAASIVYIAVENIWHHRVNISRTLIVFCFGLLHGLGFAGVLTELGLPERDFLVGLLAFNGGSKLDNYRLSWWRIYRWVSGP